MISVAMAAYNGLPYIGQQVASILAQLASDDELVVSDNGSTDGTWAWLQQQAAADPRIRPFPYTERQGVVANFEQALGRCRGDLVFLSDQDDIWLPGRVRAMTRPFADNPDLLLVQADAELIDAAGRVTAPSFFAGRRCGPGVLKNFYKNTWQGCSLCCRRRLLDLALPFPPGLPMHDMWLGLIAEICGPVLFLPAVLLQHRRHEQNRSALRRSGWLRVIGWRLRLARALLIKLSQNRHQQQLTKRH